MCIWKSRRPATLPTDPEHHILVECHSCYLPHYLCKMFDNGSRDKYLLCVHCYSIYLFDTIEMIV